MMPLPLNQCWRDFVPVMYYVQLIFQHLFAEGEGGGGIGIVSTFLAMIVVF